jgi:hypothetical protein
MLSSSGPCVITILNVMQQLWSDPAFLHDVAGCHDGGLANQ